MISLQQTEKPSPHVRERAKRMFVRSLAPTTFVVTPKEKDKARRVVRIDVSDGGIKIECLDKDIGEVCPANGFKLHCSHVEAALKRLHANIKRDANRRAKQNGN